MRIAIITLGTRGDVQPFAVLGKALQQRGHEITFCTAKNFEGLVRTYGLAFIPVDIDFQELIESDDAKKIMKNPFRIRKYLHDVIFPKMSDAFQQFYQLAKEQDKVLFHIKTLADYFADEFPGKMIRADVVPAGEPTSAFPNPVFSALGLPHFLNRFTYKLTEWGLKMWKKPIVDIRKRAGLSADFVRYPLPAIYGISEHVLAKPKDYPADSSFTGFWISESEDSTLDEDLLAFLQSGEAPLLITFGSMPFQSKFSLVELIKTLVIKQKIRILVVKGWGLSDTKEIESLSGVKVISSAPYELLLPHVKAVVHHGGIGTTAACLRAGKPMFICPVLYPFGDQHFWGTIMYRNGWALKPIALKKITTETFQENVARLLRETSLYTATENIAIKLRQENGVANAIAVIEGLSAGQQTRK